MKNAGHSKWLQNSHADVATPTMGLCNVLLPLPGQSTGAGLSLSLELEAESDQELTFFMTKCTRKCQARKQTWLEGFP